MDDDVVPDLNPGVNRNAWIKNAAIADPYSGANGATRANSRAPADYRVRFDNCCRMNKRLGLQLVIKPFSGQRKRDFRITNDDGGLCRKCSRRHQKAAGTA